MGTVLYFQNRDRNRKVEVPKYDYETVVKEMKTEFSKELEELKKYIDKKAIQTPPAIIRNYPKETKTEYKIIDINDSIITLISKLGKDTIPVSTGFLESNIIQSKLLSMDLRRDSLKLVIQNIDGNVQSKEYPIYLEEFGYYWVDNELFREKVPPPKKKRNWDFGELILYTGYEYLQTQSFDFGLNYQVDIGKKLWLSTDVGFRSFYIDGSSDTYRPYGDIKVGYKIFD